MKESIFAALISGGLSACLVFGGGAMSTFAFCVFVIFNVLAWLAVFAGAVKGESRDRMRRTAFLSCCSTGLQIAAMLVAGHPILAASSFSVSFLIMVQVFRSEEVTP